MDYPASFLAHRLSDDERVGRWSRRILAHAPLGAQGLAVDVGCGVGRFTPALAGTFTQVIGVDQDPTMLALAARRATPGAAWVVANATALPLPTGSVQFMLASMVLEHVGDKLGFFREARRVLARRGVLVLRTMLPDDIHATSWYAASPAAQLIELARTPSRETLLALAARAGLTCQTTEHVVEVVGEDARIAPLPSRVRARSYEALHQLDGPQLAQAVANSVALVAEPGWRETLASSLLSFTHRD